MEGTRVSCLMRPPVFTIAAGRENHVTSERPVTFASFCYLPKRKMQQKNAEQQE